jgi:RecB family exonuclease
VDGIKHSHAATALEQACADKAAPRAGAGDGLSPWLSLETEAGERATFVSRIEQSFQADDFALPMLLLPEQFGAV